MFSKESERYQGSIIRELLKYASVEGVISLGGGLPSPETFPSKEIMKLEKNIDMKKALQYSKTEGTNELRDAIVEFMSKRGIDLARENVLITTGSQQGIFLSSRVLMDEGSKIVVEEPTYVGAIGPFYFRSANAIPIELEKDGMNVDKIKNFNDIRFVYTVPTFQNPTGVTMGESKRKRLVELANEKRFYIIEDDPYSYLRYSGYEVSPIKKFDDSEKVVYFGTFSKIFAPGFRIGWVAASEEIINKFALYKQAVDLHSSTYSQLIIAEALNQGIIEKIIKRAKRLYKEKRDLMLKTLDDYLENATWTRPDGGLFIWATLNKSIDTQELLDYAIHDKKILYIPGSAFSMSGECNNSMRLNFSYPSNHEIVEGIRRLSEVLS